MLGAEYFIQDTEGTNLSESGNMKAVEIHQKIQESYSLFMVDLQIFKALKIRVQQYIEHI